MIQVANQKTISNLSRKSLRANKMRNFFAVVAIALTTILFTSVATIGMSMIESIEESTMRQVGGSAHGSFKYLTQEEFNYIKDHQLIKELGYSIMVGFVENKELLRRPTEMRYGTNKEAELSFALPTAGRMPQKENEIATDTIVLDKLGVPHKIGEKVVLSYSINDKKFSDTFVLSGYWKGDSTTPASRSWVSEEFIKTRLADIDQKDIKADMKAKGFYSGLVFVDVKFSNSFNVEGKLLKILSDTGYSQKDIPIGVNWAYAAEGLTSNLGAILGLIGMILLIAFSGYLIIFNIFYISVAKDTKFYGLLKTIGTTQKQIKSIVKKQALMLSILGIPAGLIFGYIIGLVLVPFTMQSLNISYALTSFNPLIFIGSALCSLLTVLISCHKPAKLASKISAIEALHYTDVSTDSHRKIKKTLNGAKLHKMALSNIFRSKKKALVVMTSLSISIILLNSVYTMVTGFDMNKYLSFWLVSDFQIADTSYFNPYMGYKGADSLTEELVHEIASLEGVEDKGKIYFQETNHKLSDKSVERLKKILDSSSDSPNSNDSAIKDEARKVLKDGEIIVHINGVDESIWNKFDITKGDFDAKKFATGNYVLMGRFSFSVEGEQTSYYDLGETVQISNDDGTQKNYQVMAIPDFPWSLTSRHSHPNGVDIYLPADELKAHVKNPTIMTAIFDVEDNYVDDIEKYLANYVNTKEPMLAYESRRFFEKQFAKTQSTYSTVGYSLSFVIALIGILNFVNYMITSIISRRREHAMLQSIGMTGKQLYKMLIFEGLYYALFTMVIVLTLGTALNYLIVSAVVGGVWFFNYQFQIMPVLICIPFLAAIAILVPFICYKSVNKMSIVERLQENTI